MILIDFSAIMYSNLMANIKPYSQGDVFNEDMLRHMVLNSLRSYRQKFLKYADEIVLACDSHDYWRKKIFPYYKANRKKFIESSGLDWNSIFESFVKIREELEKFFPYKVICIKHAEADDIIATIVQFSDNIKDKIIISRDHDFIQLHKFNVEQYDPIGKKMITHKNPNTYLSEHIMKGDAGDGIPNILCEDDYYVKENRKIRRLTQKKIDKLMETEKSEWPTDIQCNFDRNASLISLLGTRIPSEIREKIMTEYIRPNLNTHNDIFIYFIKYKLKNLMENIGDF